MPEQIEQSPDSRIQVGMKVVNPEHNWIGKVVSIDDGIATVETTQGEVEAYINELVESKEK